MSRRRPASLLSRGRNLAWASPWLAAAWGGVLLLLGPVSPLLGPPDGLLTGSSHSFSYGCRPGSSSRSSSAGLPGFETGMTRVLDAPIGLRMFQVVTAGVVEDTLFIGYADTRLARLTRSGSEYRS